ncbi:MAG TPA: 2-phospho-L-lactate guanylyltransferase [Trebonia sp.]|jgi:2-phospho-L-lactate guanylyltransferase|nr:2-phospho-L-lactate guanylyltransferase [Trebonia sp.]
MPVKVLAEAKSRLATFAGDRRPSLALAFASDTVSAVLACPDVARVLVVTSDTLAGRSLSDLGACVVPDSPDSGLNAALSFGAAEASKRWPGGAVAALTADLPALRPEELSRALREAAGFSANGEAATSFVPDAAGIGTTMYAVAPQGEFTPKFGGASRRRHASSGALELSLDKIDGLRRDVDTPDDLREAVALGTGLRTAPLASELLSRLDGCAR